MNQRDRKMCIPLQFSRSEKQALLDTCAIQRAMSEKELRKFLSNHIMTLNKEKLAPDFKFRKANGNIVTIHHDEIHKNNASAILANFTVLTLSQTEGVKHVAPERLCPLTQHLDDAIAVINHLFHKELKTLNRKWYPKPETCRDPQMLNRLERRIYDANVNLRQQE